MAQIRIQSIVEKLDYEMKRALEDAVRRVLPDAQVDRTQLFKEFRKAVGRKVAAWVSVSDGDVKTTCRHCGKET
jgi:hypothetical protein